MDKDYESIYHTLEERHWWWLGRQNLILNLIKQFSKDSRILDVGCASGRVLEILSNHGYNNITGADYSYDEIKKCRQRSITNTCVLDAKNLCFKKEQFDIIIASDILEHLKEDSETLIRWSAFLKPNGRILVFVPALNYLWSTFDDINHHYRRYSKKTLIDCVNRTPLKINRISYWNIFLFPLVLITRLIEKYLKIKRLSNDQYKYIPIVNRIFYNILKLENKLILNNANLPIGVSLMMILTK